MKDVKMGQRKNGNMKGGFMKQRRVGRKTR